jgi:hypothetical protein
LRGEIGPGQKGLSLDFLVERTDVTEFEKVVQDVDDLN